MSCEHNIGNLFIVKNLKIFFVEKHNFLCLSRFSAKENFRKAIFLV